MTSRWHQKKAKQAEEQALRDEETARNTIDYEGTLQKDLRDVAMGGGEDELFEKKLTKEEKKARAKAAREAKRKAKGGGGGGGGAAGKKGGGVGTDETENGGDNGHHNNEDEENNNNASSVAAAAATAAAAGAAVGGGGSGSAITMGNSTMDESGIDQEGSDLLASEGTICTFSTSRKGVDARSRDVNVQNFTLQHKGMVMLDETEIVLNHGNRYGLIGRNGCGKSTFLKALGCRAVPIPRGIDVFHLKEEVEASDTMTALEAVMSVDEERTRLEAQAEELNQLMTTLSEEDGNAAAGGGGGNDGDSGDDGKTTEELQEEVMDVLNQVYERLDGLDAATAEVRARTILKGLGFTHEMQSKLTKDFSGGWRMRVSLARALFIQPVCLLLDEPTNHLDMEAVIWLEDYLSRWDKILLLISHSQDFLNNVCTHMIHFTNKRKLVHYDGNYDQFIKTKGELEENQLKQYKWEQEQIRSMKEYIARFGHGTSKNAKQAQSKEKVLQKMVRAGLTEKPEEEKMLNFRFPDPGQLPPPVLAFHDVEFGYPGCEPLYRNVNFGVDLDSRVALVGPNGAGKTTLVKLMAGELQPTLGDIRPHGHLKMGRFTQHFVDVLDLDSTPLEFFDKLYPGDPREEQRKYLGRFGVSGKMQVQKMGELSDGQKSRVVFAKLGREVPHILLLDEPTNHLDMESIDALAKAVNEFNGGMVLVSHDMRLISQVAREIWICDNKTITRYKGDIQNFKMDMRAQMGIDGEQKGELRGDASVKKKKESGAADADDGRKAATKKRTEQSKKLEVVVAAPRKAQQDSKGPPSAPPVSPLDRFSGMEQSLPKGAGGATLPPSEPAQQKSEPSKPAPKRYIPPHLRKKAAS